LLSLNNKEAAFPRQLKTMAVFVATTAAAEIVVAANAAVGGIAVAFFARSSADSDPPAGEGCEKPEIREVFVPAGFI